jgi:type I restriction enzyme S subunit
MLNKAPKIELNKLLVLRNIRANSNNIPVLSVSNTRGFINQSEQFSDRKISSEDTSNYKTVFKDDYAYNPARINVGSLARLRNFEKGIVSPMYVVFSANANVSKNYLDQFFLSSIFKQQMRVLLNGSVRQTLDFSALQEMTISTPTLSEQEKIGSFLTSIDSLIEKQKAKVDRLKSLKNVYLQKMFPDVNELTPQLRFKSYKSSWQKGLTSDLLIERIEIESKSNTYPLMSFVSGRGVVPKSDRYNREFLVSDVEGKDYKKTEFGDFIYSSNNLETGSIGLNNYGKATISPIYSIFYPSQKTTSTFIGRLFLRKPFIYQMLRFRQGVVYGQWRIHEKHFLKIPILYPTQDEQSLIGSFFDRLDTLISKEEAAIEQYESLKQGYLQRIFAD